jgi:hypothetical protein
MRKILPSFASARGFDLGNTSEGHGCVNSGLKRIFLRAHVNVLGSHDLDDAERRIRTRQTEGATEKDVFRSAELLVKAPAGAYMSPADGDTMR